MIENGQTKTRLLELADGHVPKGQLATSTLAITVLSLALPIMTLQIYDRILPNPDGGTLPVLITGVCIAIILEMILRLTRAYILEWSGAAYEHKMSCRAMDHILNADLAHMGTAGIGENLNRMTAINRLKNFYNGHSFVTKFELMFVPVYMLVTIYVAGVLAVVPMVVLMVFTLVSLSMGQKLFQNLKCRENYDDKRYNFLISTLDNIHTVKAQAIENFLARKYEYIEDPSTRANYDVTELTSKNFNASTVFSHLMIALVVTVGAVLVLRGNMTAGALIAAILLSGRMMQPVQKAIALWTQYQDFKIADDRLDKIFSIPKQSFVQNPDAKNLEIKGRIEMQDMSFQFGAEESPVFKSLNFQVMPGETILISGSHASGKTTLLNLIAGLYLPSSGSIEIDGCNTAYISPEMRGEHIGYIHTEGTIFTGTIRENITCFGQIPEAATYEIARLLKVDRDVARLPGGFDTTLSGAGADGVAPGLKQRISIVRALARRPKVILFDNADRGLDLEGYNSVYTLLARLKGKASMVLVSEDYNISDLADRGFILQGGELKEIEYQFNPGDVRPYRELNI